MEFKHLVLSALLLSTTSQMVLADTIGWGQPQRPGQPSQPQFPQQPQDPWDRRDDRREERREDRREERREDRREERNRERTVEENVQSYFQGQSRLDLLTDYYVRAQLQGLKISSITIVASTEMGNGTASLVLNGQSLESSKTVARQMSSYTFRADPFANEVGRSLSRIELAMQGKFYVDKVIFNVLEASGPNGPGPGFPQPGPQIEVIRQQLSERIQQEGGLELFRMFNLLNEKRGQEVKRVTVLARSDRGFAQASLMLNGQQSYPQSLNYGSNRLTFEVSPGMRIGQEISALKLYFRGDVVVEEVSIELDKRGGNAGGFPIPQPPVQRRIEQIVNQRLYDTNGVSLASLMQIQSMQLDREVESVELTLRNSDMGVRLKLCQVIQDRAQTQNCANPVTISSGAQVVRLSGVNFARLRETQLSTRMGMIDIERIAINLR